MPMTNAERQRRHREKREADLKKTPDAAARHVRGAFAEFFAADEDRDGGDWKGVEEVFAYAGVSLPDLAKNEWPEFDEFGLQASGLRNNGALGRAEMLAGAMQEGLRVLTAKINRFKREGIAARIGELESSDLSDPDRKREALAMIVELRRIEGRLDKFVRLSFPAYKIKG